VTPATVRASIRLTVRSSNGLEIRFDANVHTWRNAQKRPLTKGLAPSPLFGVLHRFSVERVLAAS
jgi:hypothetical protein